MLDTKEEYNATSTMQQKKCGEKVVASVMSRHKTLIEVIEVDKNAKKMFKVTKQAI